MQNAKPRNNAADGSGTTVAVNVVCSSSTSLKINWPSEVAMLTEFQFAKVAVLVIGPMDVVMSQVPKTVPDGPRIKSVDGGNANPTKPPVFLKTESCGVIEEVEPAMSIDAEFDRMRIELGNPGTA